MGLRSDVGHPSHPVHPIMVGESDVGHPSELSREKEGLICIVLINSYRDGLPRNKASGVAVSRLSKNKWDRFFRLKARIAVEFV